MTLSSLYLGVVFVQLVKTAFSIDPTTAVRRVKNIPQAAPWDVEVAQIDRELSDAHVFVRREKQDRAAHAFDIAPSGSLKQDHVDSHNNRAAQQPSGELKLVTPNGATLDLMRAFKTIGSCISDRDHIRVGGPQDGGYVFCKPAVETADLMISIGIRGFDPASTGISEMVGVRAEQYDCTSGGDMCPPKAARCNVHFNQICASGTELPNRNGFYANHKFQSLGTMISSSGVTGDNLILKIDCEGCEWDVLADVSEETLKRFRMILGEFHWLEKTAEHAKYSAVMDKLARTHRLTHTHGCNCFGQWGPNGTEYHMPKIVETTMIRKDLSKPSPYTGNKYYTGLFFPICGVNGVRQPEFFESDFALPS